MNPRRSFNLLRSPTGLIIALIRVNSRQPFGTKRGPSAVAPKANDSSVAQIPETVRRDMDHFLDRGYSSPTGICSFGWIKFRWLRCFDCLCSHRREKLL